MKREEDQSRRKEENTKVWVHEHQGRREVRFSEKGQMPQTVHRR